MQKSHPAWEECAWEISPCLVTDPTDCPVNLSVILGAIVLLQPYKHFFFFFFLLGLCSTHTPGRPEVQFVLTKGKAIPKQHKDCRGFSLWEQMAVLNPTQSFYSLESSLNQHLMTSMQRKNFCPSRFGS